MRERGHMKWKPNKEKRHLDIAGDKGEWATLELSPGPLIFAICYYQIKPIVEKEEEEQILVYYWYRGQLSYA